MHAISRKKLREFWADHPEAEEPLNRWFKLVKHSVWKKFADVRALFPTADQVEKFVVFNVAGNKYRIVVDIYYEGEVVLVRHVLTRTEHDKNQWKIRP